MLELAKIEAGKITITLEDVPLGALLHECIPLVLPMAQKKSVEINLDSRNCRDVVVEADRVRLKQAVLNLLSNAVKYNRDGGSVSVYANVADKGMMHVCVMDTGLGIAADAQDDLFRPFERLGREASAIEGTGIGLTITRDLVRLMGGEIGFSSEVGRGSTFWVEIPLAETTTEENKATVSGKAKSQSLDLAVGEATEGHTILYVEDNPANLILMEKAIGRAPNLDLISAHTAELGIEMAQARHPDLILMDINLPGVDGFEALRRLKKHKETSAIPVIAITAAAMPHEVIKGKDAGFHAYVTKPIQLDALFDAMRHALAIDHH